MFKTLLKKQITEVFRGYFYDYKKNKPLRKESVIFRFVLFGVLMVFVIGGMFATLSLSLCVVFSDIGLDWLYFDIVGLIAILLGVFGSVFSTFSGLYLAKDNDTLLAMPIPLKYIILSRLVNVYIMGTMYSILVILPAIVIYWIFGCADVSTVIGGIVLLVFVTLFVTVLSCILGWVVAKISVRIKSKSAVTVIIALLAIAAYYFVFYRAQDYINMITENALYYGDRIQSKATVLYYFGSIGSGNYLSMIIFLAVVLLLAAAVFFIISKSFMNIATDTGVQKGKEYRGGTLKVTNVSGALLRKELNRFTGSANYMLNCGLGILFMIVIAVVLVIKGGTITNLLSEIGDMAGGIMVIILFGIISLVGSMIDIAAPSVSLEGKSVWILQSLPISAGSVLKAKLRLQLIFAMIPTLICTVCAVAVFGFGTGETIMILVTCLTYVVLSSNFNMFLGIRMPIMSWSNETIPIKQSGSVLAAIFGGWGIAVVLAGPYFIFANTLSATVYLVIIEVVMIIASILLHSWIMNKGAERFENL